jgi:hypothetical protein
MKERKKDTKKKNRNEKGHLCPSMIRNSTSRN